LEQREARDATRFAVFHDNGEQLSAMHSDPLNHFIVEAVVVTNGEKLLVQSFHFIPIIGMDRPEQEIPHILSHFKGLKCYPTLTRSTISLNTVGNRPSMILHGSIQDVQKSLNKWSDPSRLVCCAAVGRIGGRFNFLLVRWKGPKVWGETQHLVAEEVHAHRTALHRRDPRPNE
jgi:hypothetical protein